MRDRLDDAATGAKDIGGSAGEFLKSAGRRTSASKRTPLSLIRRFVARLIGSPEQQSTRFLLALIAISGFVGFIGVFFIASGTVSATASSSWLVRAFASVVTNFALYSALAVIGAVVAINRWWDLAAGKTAEHTRYSKRTVKRFAAEVKSTDGTTRLIGNADHSENELRAKLMRAFAGQSESETPDEDEQVEAVAPVDTGYGIPDGAAINERAAEATDDVDSSLEGVSLLTAKQVVRLRIGHLQARLVANDLEDHGYRADHGRPLPAVAETADEDADADTHGDETAAVDDSPETKSFADIFADFRRARQTARMDIATSFNADEILWRFGLPAIGTVFAAMVVAQTPWFAGWVYPVLIAIGVAVGATSYLTFKWRRRRAVRSLREEREPKRWRTCVTLAKRVETPEQTLFVAWMGGHVYADYDRHRLARKVADRWHARLQGNDVAPAMQEKFARNVRQMLPMLHQFEYGDAYEGRKAIMDDIITTVSEARDPDGMVPKFELAEKVVERGEGVGHDPDIVAEVYEGMVPTVLTETDITVTDADGTPHDITAVHLRTMDIPDDLARIRAQFSNQFAVDNIDGYPLPDIPMPGGPRHLVAGTDNAAGGR
ncbi:hypothetical protein [Haloferax sulfurifontis]|uniref:Uncharacterized protein n=2 Tax=Haloferax sulfurifontis TaxID=255616 RepID=M0IIK6_9EURY|nr:hypothetical protein [Haloferax sulfurifontis]ELZ96580.1 hypothetical protein C441_04409 [Haloferax sulfurifontis ATCC BAA-897]GGC72702.1 hypothetical protein GCM10007209_38330 [Haloferax sulfurifontis]